MAFIFKKKIFAVMIIAILFSASLLFREEVSRLLSFKDNTPVSSSLRPHISVKPEETIVTPPTLQPSSPKQKEDIVVLPLPVSYTGRDPEEVRPVPDEVKLFTEDQKNQLYSSIKAHGQLVKTNPAYFFGWIQIGILKKTIGDFDGAMDAWEYAGVIEPKNSISFANLGELYWRYLHQYSKSEANLKISIQHKSDDVQTYVTLAELYHYSYKEKYDIADDVLIEGLKANPGSGTLMRRLAYLYEQRQEWSLALGWWEKVLVSAPDDEEVKNKIKRAKSKLGATP